MAELEAGLQFNTDATGSGGAGKDRSQKNTKKTWDHPHHEPRKGKGTGTLGHVDQRR